MKKSICLVALAMIGAVAAFADIPDPSKYPQRTPKPRPGMVTRMNIRLDREATEAKLIIPRSQLKQLRAELDQLDGDAPDPASGSLARTQTIISGVFLSLALVFGGIWFVRSGKGTALVVIGTLMGVASAATFVYANIGPPPEVRTINGQMFSQSMHRYKSGSGQVKVESSTEADEIEFIVPDPRSAGNEE